MKLEWNGEGPHQFGVYRAPLEIQGSTNAATGVRPLDYHELGIRYRCLHTDYTAASGADATRRLLSVNPSPTAIIYGVGRKR